MANVIVTSQSNEINSIRVCLQIFATSMRIPYVPDVSWLPYGESDISVTSGGNPATYNPNN